MAKKPSPDELRKLKDKAAEAVGKGKLDKAAELYREAADGDPRDVATRQKLADTLRRAGRTAEAIRAYRDVADRFGKDGLLIKAIAISKTILELDPDHVETQAALADLYAKRAKAEGARPPPRTMMVQAMKSAAATPAAPPRAAQARPAGEPVVAIALGPPPPGERDPFAAAPPPAGPRPPPPAPDAIEISVEPEPLPEVEVPLEPGPRPVELVLGSGDVAEPVPEPTLEGEPILEVVPEPAAPPSPAPAPAARRATTAFAQIVFAAEAAVEAGIEEDLLVRADPPDAEVLEDEPLSFEPSGGEAAPVATAAARGDALPAPVGDAAAAGDEGLELIVEPEPVRPPEPRPAAVAPAAPASAPPVARPAAARPPAPALPRIPIFSDLSRDAFVELMRGMVLHHVSPGEAVLREGDEGTSFYVVAGGKLAVSKRDEGGAGQIVLARLGDGDFFGEMALLSGAPRSATVTAEEESEILEFRADVLLGAAGHHPHVAQSLRRFYRQRLLANALAVSPIFRPFGRGDRKLIMERFRAREVTEGEVVIREGTPSDGLYVVLEGAVDVLKQKGGHEVVAAQLREGDLFGEMSCLRKAPASATIVVRRPGTLLRLPRKEFDELVVTYPQILELVSTLSEERAENLDAILSGAAEWTGDGLVLT